MIKQFEIPDVRDGLTTLQRRMLWMMKTMRLTSKKSYTKAAHIIIETEKGEKELQKFFDFIYDDIMIPMTQKWHYPLPMIEGHGNWGSMTGEYEAAAPRFTECRLTEFSEKTLLIGLNQRIVKYILNPNTQKKEPSVLTAGIPNALVSGTSGNSHIPPHNLGEVIDAVIAMIKNSDLKTEQLLDYIKGPDFPTGGTIINKNELPQIYQSGAGEFRIRGTMELKTSIESEKCIIVREIPYTMIGKVEKFVEYIQSEYMKEFFFTDITKVEIFSSRFDSAKNNVNISITLNETADIHHNKELLYEYSELESNFDYRALLTSNRNPCLMSLHQILSEWLDFYREMKTKQKHGISPTDEELIEALLKIKDQFATPRKTKIIDAI